MFFLIVFGQNNEVTVQQSPKTPTVIGQSIITWTYTTAPGYVVFAEKLFINGSTSPIWESRGTDEKLKDVFGTGVGITAKVGMVKLTIPNVQMKHATKLRLVVVFVDTVNGRFDRKEVAINFYPVRKLVIKFYFFSLYSFTFITFYSFCFSINLDMNCISVLRS